MPKPSYYTGKSIYPRRVVHSDFDQRDLLKDEDCLRLGCVILMLRVIIYPREGIQ